MLVIFCGGSSILKKGVGTLYDLFPFTFTFFIQILTENFAISNERVGVFLKGVGQYMLVLGLVQTWPCGQKLVIFCGGSRVLKKGIGYLV